MSHEAEALEELIKGIQTIVDNAMVTTTKIYDGIVLSENNNGKWNVKYNGEVHPIRPYSSFVPTINALVKVYIPQGNHSLAYFAPKSGNLGIQQANDSMLGGVKVLEKKPDQVQPVGIDENGQLFVKDSNGEYPIGAVYTSYSDVSPDTLFGGTWEQVYADYTRECIASQTILGDTATGKELKEKSPLIGTYQYDLLSGLTEGITVPNGTHIEYRMTFQGYTNKDTSIIMYLNNIATSPVRTYSKSTFRKIGSTGFFKIEDIELADVIGYEDNTDKGINLYYEITGEAGEWRVYNVSLTAYIVSDDMIYKWKKIAGKENA